MTSTPSHSVHRHPSEDKKHALQLKSCSCYSNGCCVFVCSVPWPLYRSEARDDLVLLQNCQLFTCKSCYSHANKPLTRSFICDKHWGRIVTKQGPFGLESIKRPGHWAHNYKNGLLWHWLSSHFSFLRAIIQGIFETCHFLLDKNA